MCGDGTNDVGALKAAHVGVSIVNDPDFEKRIEEAKDPSVPAHSGGKKAKGIVEVKTKRQIIFPFSDITTQNNRNKSSFERENREIWRIVVTATISPFI